jgi:hypothetical protein
MDCFVASLLAMTTGMHPRSRRGFHARFGLLVPPSFQRAQGMPDAWCARSGVCEGRKQKAHALVRSHRKHPAFPAQWFYGFLRALPGDRALLPPSSAISRQLDASVEASGPHDFAVRFCAIRQRRIHVHRIPPRVRDDREPPLCGTGCAHYKFDLGYPRKGIFFRRGLDTR